MFHGSMYTPDTAFPQINDSMCSECDRKSDGMRRKLKPNNGMMPSLSTA